MIMMSDQESKYLSITKLTKLDYDKDYYPSKNDINDIPPTLLIE